MLEYLILSTIKPANEKGKMRTKTINSRTYPRHLFLEGILRRLEKDVNPYILLIHKHAAETMSVTGSPEIIGNWALLRMVLPPLYATAKAIPNISYDDAESNENSLVRELMDTLEVPCPALVIEMYRHSLMHGDSPRGIVVNGLRASWSLSIGSMGHFAHSGVIHIDIEVLYRDLIAYLNAQIEEAKSAGELIEMPGDAIFTQKAAEHIVTEMTLLHEE